MSDEFKAKYVTLNGHTSTAYVTAEPSDENMASGEDKYTDEPVTVVWVEADQQWVEVQ